MAVDDIYKVTHTQSVHGITAVNVHHYKQTASSTGVTSEEDLATAFFASVMTVMQTNLATAWRSECIVVREITAGASTPWHQVTGIPGSQPAGEALPCSSVGVISAYTEQYDKSGRGRFFISGMKVADEADNCWVDASGGRLVLIASAIGGDATGGGGGGTFDAGIWSLPGPSFKSWRKMETRSQVRKLRSRTQARACG